MLKFSTIALLCLGLTLALLLGITLSLPLQSPALISLGLAALLGGVLAFRAEFNMPVLLPVIAAIGYFIARTLLSPVVDLATEDLFLILGASIVYLLLGTVTSSPVARTASAWVVVFLLCLHMGSVVIQLMGGIGYSPVRLFTLDIRPEGNVITGMYGYIGSFANFAAIAGVLTFCIGVWGRVPKWFRASLFLLSLFSLVATCLAQSRSAMVSLAIGGVVLFVLLWISVAQQNKKVRQVFRSSLLVSGMVGLVLSVLGAVWVFNSRAQDADGADVMFNSEVRLAYWPMAVEQFIDHPIVGAGSRSYSYECFKYWNPNLDTGEANPEFAHNEYLQVLADYGFIGFILVLGLLLMHVVMGIKQVRLLAGRVTEDGLNRGSNAMALTIAGLVGIVIMGVHVMFDFRTHLLANLLLLVCCLTWVLPARKGGQPKPGGLGILSKIVLMPVLVILGLASVSLGYVQLKGGMPLLINQMAAETGHWYPSAVKRDVWIPALEASVEQAPSYRRHLKLGTLYRLQADDISGADRNDLLKKAAIQYEKAEARHPFEPVAKLNLAAVHTSLKDFEMADSYYKKADKIASSREKWFRIHVLWADLHRQWAGDLWRKEQNQQAASHYQRAMEILADNKVQNNDSTQVYLMVLIEYSRLLDNEGNYLESDSLYEGFEKSWPVYIVNSLKLNIRREMGAHYLRHAKHLWYARKPEQAHAALVKAEKSYRIHRVVLKGQKDEQAEQDTSEVQQILEFFKNTGVGTGE